MDWQELRNLAHQDILAYMALIKPESKFGPQHYFFRDIISDLAARRRRFICLSCPPRHSKSYTFSQSLPAWWLGKFPKDQVIATSYTASLAQSFGKSTRADMSSDIYAKIFSTDSQPAGKGVSGTDFSTNAGGKYKATGVGGSLTGFGGNLIVVDDPIKNAETADSPTYKDMLEKFFSETLYTRLMPNGVIVVMMTRWREDDLVGYIIRNFPEWEYVNVPALVEEQDVDEATGLDFLGRRVGDALWPEFFTSADLDRNRKVLGESAFQALYQGRPVSAKGGLVTKDYINYTDVLPTGCPGFWSWDTALSANQTADYSVGQRWIVDGERLILADYVRGRWDFVELLKFVKGLAERSDDRFILIENSHGGMCLRDSLIEQLGDDYTVRLFSVKKFGDKLTRLQVSLEQWKSGGVFFYLPLMLREDFAECLDEILKAGKTKNDDFLDATTQAILEPKDVIMKQAQNVSQGSQIMETRKRQPIPQWC